MRAAHSRATIAYFTGKQRGFQGAASEAECRCSFLPAPLPKLLANQFVPGEVSVARPWGCREVSILVKSFAQCPVWSSVRIIRVLVVPCDWLPLFCSHVAKRSHSQGRLTLLVLITIAHSY